MILAHSWFVHILFGGFFGWWGVLGALVPDIVLIFKLVRINGESQWWHEFLHSIPAVLLGVGLWSLLLSIGWISAMGWSSGMLFWVGYLTHVAGDAWTEAGDLSRIFLMYPRRGWWTGVNWWRCRWYWPEWLGLGNAAIWYLVGVPNVVVETLPKITHF